MEDQFIVKSVLVFLFVVATGYLAYYSVLNLLWLFSPALPYWACCVGGVVLTLVAMVVIVVGAGNFFYEGLVIWTLLAVMGSYGISMVMHTRELQQKRALRQQQKARQQQLTPVPKKAS